MRVDAYYSSCIIQHVDPQQVFWKSRVRSLGLFLGAAHLRWEGGIQPRWACNQSYLHRLNNEAFPQTSSKSRECQQSTIHVLLHKSKTTTATALVDQVIKCGYPSHTPSTGTTHAIRTDNPSSNTSLHSYYPNQISGIQRHCHNGTIRTVQARYD